MTIKEYTVTDKVLTYLKQYDSNLGHARIKMPYTVNQFSNLINETYEELKFKLKLTKKFIKKPACTICDFYCPHISNLKIKEGSTRATHAFLYGNKKTFLFEVNKYYLLNPIIDLEFGPYKMNRIEIDEIEVDAVFTITDVVAIGVLKYLNDHKIKVPEEIAIFGFSNWFMSSIVSPSLSTVNQPGYEMGKTAVEILLKEIKNKKKNITFDYTTIVLETELVIRESS